MGCLIAVVVYWEYWWPAFPVLVYFKVSCFQPASN